MRTVEVPTHPQTTENNFLHLALVLFPPLITPSSAPLTSNEHQISNFSSGGEETRKRVVEKYEKNMQEKRKFAN